MYDASSVGFERACSWRLTPVSLAVAGAAVASLTIACSVLLDANLVQCTAHSDCVDRGFAETQCVNKVCVGAADASTADAADSAPVDPKWGCLGTITWGAQDVNAPKVVLRQRFVRLLGEGPVVQMSVTACGQLDVSCALPFAAGTTDDDGNVSLSVPKYFSGFLALEPPATFTSMVPSLFTVLPPPEKDDDPDAAGRAPHLASTGEINALLAQIGSSLDPNLATLFGIVVDCQGKLTSGVSLRIEVRDKKTTNYYIDDTGTPSVTAQETGTRGGAGFLHTPTGPVSVLATVTALGKPLGRFTILAKAGHITYVVFGPGPS